MIVVGFPAKRTQFSVQFKTDGESGDNGYFIVDFRAVNVAYTYHHGLLEKAHFHVYVQ